MQEKVYAGDIVGVCEILCGNKATLPTAMNCCAKLLIVLHDGRAKPACLPYSASACVIIQHSQTMLPGNVTCWLWYFADNTQ